MLYTHPKLIRLFFPCHIWDLRLVWELAGHSSLHHFISHLWCYRQWEDTLVFAQVQPLESDTTFNKPKRRLYCGKHFLYSLKSLWIFFCFVFKQGDNPAETLQDYMILQRAEFGMQVAKQSESHFMKILNHAAEPGCFFPGFTGAEDKSQGEACPLVALRLCPHIYV